MSTRHYHWDACPQVVSTLHYYWHCHACPQVVPPLTLPVSRWTPCWPARRCTPTPWPTPWCPSPLTGWPPHTPPRRSSTSTRCETHWLSCDEFQTKVHSKVHNHGEGPYYNGLLLSGWKQLLPLSHIRHYAKQALTPRSLNMKLGPQRKGYKGRAGWLA